MKVNPIQAFPAAIQAQRRVEDKTDTSSGGGFSQQYEQQQKEEKSEEPSSEFKVNDQAEIDAAISTFSADQQTVNAGLTAESFGQGPGLRVILKDGSGAVIRQMTGEEFLKLRSTVGNERETGKLIDQKL